MRRPPRTRLLATLVLVGVMIPATTATAQDEAHVVDRGDDVVIEEGDGPSLAPQASDPLGLLVGVDTIRDHTLGIDVLEVWTCGAAGTAADYVEQLDEGVVPWFQHHSRGWYLPSLVSRGDAGAQPEECRNNSTGAARSNASGALHVIEAGGGFASPGLMCGFTPCPGSGSYADGNRRAGFIGTQMLVATTAHEMGHMLSWPHSYTGEGDDEYDNAMDVMSGNYGVQGNRYGSYPEPYGTAVINLYAAGWIPAEEVYVFDGEGASLDLATQAAGDGWKMAVIRAGNSFFTLSARVPSQYDPIPDHWSGVEVYEVETCRSDGPSCVRDDRYTPGFRRVRPSPGVPFDPRDRDLYDQSLPHVIRPGDSRMVGGVEISVGNRSGQSFRVDLGADPRPVASPLTVSFRDTGDHVFAADIEWLSSSGITRGCNPPLSSRFCPDDVVTRGQMAAFLHRALPDLSASGSADFADDDGSVFESDIEWLAATGVTRGCNPPANDRFCPNDVVTRAQMAAFLHRALPDLSASGSADFADDDGSVFESDIEWLAATGVTRGCNPPANDRFCPNDPVTRGAMAAFLQRALGG